MVKVVSVALSLSAAVPARPIGTSPPMTAAVKEMVPASIDALPGALKTLIVYDLLLQT